MTETLRVQQCVVNQTSDADAKRSAVHAQKYMKLLLERSSPNWLDLVENFKLQHPQSAQCGPSVKVSGSTQSSGSD